MSLKFPTVATLGFVLLISGITMATAQPRYSYLNDLVDESEQPMLDFYYETMCHPGSIKAGQLVLPEDASPNEKALYYFGLKNLQRYEGLRNVHTPNLVALGEQVEMPWIVAEAKLNRAIDLIDSDLLLEGQVLLHEVVSIANGIGYKRLAGRAYRWLGNAKIQRSDIISSLRYYKKAFSLVTEVGDSFQSTMTLNNIATVYMQSEDWESARDYVERALKLYHSHNYGNSLFEAVMNSNASTIYFALNDVDKAKQFMALAQKEAEKTGSKKVKYTTLSNLSQLLSGVGQADEALAIGQQCLALDTDGKDLPLQIAGCFQALAKAYLVKQNYDESIYYGIKVVDILHQSETREVAWEMEVLGILIDAYEGKQDYQNALLYFRQQDNIRRDYYKDAYGQELLSEKNALEKQLNQRDLALLEAKNQLQEEKLNAQRTREILYLALFTLVIYVAAKRLFKMKRINRELENENTRDSLTKLNNRRYLEKWLKAFHAKPFEHPYALAVIDIDFFKGVNDQYGHEAGDKVLQGVAKALKNAIRPEDVLVRWGGEEFVLLLQSKDKWQTAKTLERLRSAVASEIIELEDESIKVTISLGAASVKASELKVSWKALFSNADSALYKAKNNGRNRFEISD